MELHKQLACCYNPKKDARSANHSDWNALSEELNSVGPPIRKCSEWKRVRDVYLRI